MEGTALVSVILFTIVAVWYFGFRRRYRVPLPPGPPGDPIVGHLRFIPSKYQENLFSKWGKLYGDVVYYHLFNQPVIILNSAKAAVDLLEKRSANYSDRPVFTLLNLMGWDKTISFNGYSKRFQRHRRLLQDTLNSRKCKDYQPIQLAEARLLLRNLISDGERREDFVGRFSTSIIMSIAYGHQIVSDNDPYVKMTNSVGHAMGNSGSPASTPVDFFPFLRHLPPWFPGTYYATYARNNKYIIDDLHNFPYYEVQRLMIEGKAKPSFLSRHIERIHREGDGSWASVEDVKSVAGVMYCAGAETTWTVLSFFFLAMTIYPQYQTKAQEEIDSVIGPDRLPEFRDRESLPFVEAILQETLRWKLVTPLGVPHKSMEDDVYNGMLIPKGSLVIANARAITTDERFYANPDEFDPTRYLPIPQGRAEPFPSGPFGFGRRICPGRYLADANMWIAIASILATLRISKPIDEHGEEIAPIVAVTSGMISRPEPFECRIEPRNAHARALVDQTATWDF